MRGCSLRQRVNAQGSCSLAIGGLAPPANLWMAPRVAEPEGAVPITPFRACNPKRANILTQADPAWALLNRRLGLKPCTLCVRPRVWVSVRSKATSAKQGARVAQTADLRSAAFRSGFATDLKSPVPRYPAALPLLRLTAYAGSRGTRCPRQCRIPLPPPPDCSRGVRFLGKLPYLRPKHRRW